MAACGVPTQINRAAQTRLATNGIQRRANLPMDLC
jgi:hypothetical protein